MVQLAGLLRLESAIPLISLKSSTSMTMSCWSDAKGID